MAACDVNAQVTAHPDCSTYDPSEPTVLQRYRYPFGNAHLTYTLPADSTLIVEHRGDFGEYWDWHQAPVGGGVVKIPGNEIQYIVYAIVVKSSDFKQEMEWLILEARSHGAITATFTGDNTKSLGLNPCIDWDYVA
jgi:hypothetical protein